MAKIDLERCRRGMRQLRVSGTPRPALIEEAIAAIGRNPLDALRDEYFGIKNYAHFGDQRADCPYNMGPKHGSIVFSIGRTGELREVGKALDTDAIYYLEAYRDFPGVEWTENEGSYVRKVVIDLGRAIAAFDELTKRRNHLADAFEAMPVHAHING